MANQTKNKITLRDRKKAQPKAVIYFSDQEKATIQETIASNLSLPQFKIFIYTAQALGLNPLVNEICAVIYKTKNDKGVYDKKMSIQVMRDGFLTIAHRSGKFAGLESGIYEKGDKKVDGVIANERTAWAKAYHKDFVVPVYQEVEFSEYDNSARNPLWKTKPKTMIKKVAESMALRKAFNVNGVYAPEEMEKEIVSESVAPKVLELKDGSKPATESQRKTIKSLLRKQGMVGKIDIDPELTKQQAAEKIQELSNKK